MSDINNAVTLTPDAATEVQRMLKTEEKGKLLRVYVEAGGCSGLEYGLVLITLK